MLLLITIDQTLTEFLVGVWVYSQKSPVHSNSTGLVYWHTVTSTSTVTSTVTTWATATTATLTLIATTLRMCSLPLCPGQSQPHKMDANPLVCRCIISKLSSEENGTPFLPDDCGPSFFSKPSSTALDLARDIPMSPNVHIL